MLLGFQMPTHYTDDTVVVLVPADSAVPPRNMQASNYGAS